MAAIRETIELVDAFSPVINAIVGSVNYAVSAMEKLHLEMGKSIDTGPINAARTQVNNLNDIMRRTGDISENTRKALGNMGTAGNQMAQKMSGTCAQTESLNNAVSKMAGSVGAAQNALSGISSTSARTGGAVKNVGDSTEETGKKAGNMSAGLNSAMSAMTSLFIAAGGYKVLNYVKEGFSEAVKAAAEFETSMTNISKVTGASQEGLKEYSENVKKMALEMPISTSEIASVMTAGSRLGIDNSQIESFSKTAIGFSNISNMTTDAAADFFAKFANITNLDTSQYENLASAVAYLGNNFATTEADIANMTNYLSSASTLAGLTQSDILGLATAMLSVGISAESGGSAMSTLITKMQLAVETGDKLEDFAAAAGMSADQFADTFRNNAVGAIEAFITGLNDVERNGASATVVLDDMGLKNIRLSNTIKALASSGDVLSSAVSASSKAWEENNTLTSMTSKQYTTLESKMTMAENAAHGFKEAIGTSLLPVMKKAVDIKKDFYVGLTDIAEAFPSLTAGATVAGSAFGTMTGTLMTAVPTISSAVTALTSLKNSSEAFSSLSMGGFLSEIGLLKKLLVGGGIVAGVSLLAGGVAALYTAYSNAQNKVEDYNGTLEQCRDEILNTRIAYESVVKVYGEQSEAAEALRNNIELLNQQYAQGGGAAEEYTKRMQETAEKLQSVKDDYADKIDEITNNQQYGMVSAAQLEALSNKTRITDTDLDQMTKYADFLNDTFHFNIEVDYDAGKLSGFNLGNINSTMAKTMNENRMRAAAESVNNIGFTSGYADAIKDLSDLKVEYINTKTEIEKAMLDPSYVNNTGFTLDEADEFFKSKITGAKIKVSEYQNEVRNAYSTMGVPEQADGYIKILDNMAKSSDYYRTNAIKIAAGLGEVDSFIFPQGVNFDMSKFSGGMSEYVNFMKQVTGDMPIDNLSDFVNTFEKVCTSTADIAQATTDNANKIDIPSEKINPKIQSIRDNLELLSGAYNETYNSCFESFSKQFDLFDTAEIKTEYTFDKFKKARESQNKYRDTAADDLAYIVGLSAESLDMSEEEFSKFKGYLHGFADESNEYSVGVIHDVRSNLENGNIKIAKDFSELLSTTDKSISNVSNVYSGGLEIIRDTGALAETAISETTKLIEDKANEMIDSAGKAENGISDTVNNINGLSGAAQDATGNVMNGLVNGINDNLGILLGAADSVRSAVDNIIAAANVSRVQNAFEGISNAAHSISLSIPGFATGTLSAPSGLALVGEKGPELIYLHGGERVYNNDETRRIFEGLAMSSPVTNVTSSTISSITSIANTNTDKTAFESVSSSAQSFFNSVSGCFASGTLSAPKGIALVGEKGPELISLNGGERIYNNDETNLIMEKLTGNTLNSEKQFIDSQILTSVYIPQSASEAIDISAPDLTFPDFSFSEISGRSENVSTKNINITINGENIPVTQGMNKNEILAAIREYAVSAVTDAIGNAMFEEGDDSYVY